MSVFCKTPEGKEVPVELVEGVPVVLRYYGEARYGRFVRLEASPGHRRWDCLMVHAIDHTGTPFSGPFFWFEVVLSAKDKAAFEALFNPN